MLLIKNYIRVLHWIFYFFPIAFLFGSVVLNLTTITILLLGSIYFFTQKIKLKFNVVNISLLLFFLTVIYSSYINIETIGRENFIKSFFLLRFFFIYILLEILFQNKSINIKIFFFICFTASLFISLDLSLQFFYGKNILGYEPWEGRITGIFKDEAIAGAYIQKIFIFSLVFFLSLKNSINKIKLIGLLSLIIIIFGSLVANNRISFIIILSTLAFVLLFYEIMRKLILICFLVIFIIFIYFFINNSQIYNHYTDFKNKIFLSLNFKSNFDLYKKNFDHSYEQVGNNIIVKLPEHAKIYLTSFESFKENKIFGNGLKSFRIKCKKFINQENFLCSTHPHNYHLEILHDTGFIGFFLISFFVFSLIINTLKILISKNIINEKKIILSLIFINFLIEIFPFKSTGSIFTTWNGTMLWLSVGMINYKNYCMYYDKKKIL